MNDKKYIELQEKMYEALCEFVVRVSKRENITEDKKTTEAEVQILPEVAKLVLKTGNYS